MMKQKTEQMLFEEWNEFSDITFLGEDFLKIMVDNGIKPTFTIHKNFSGMHRRLGDAGIINLEYTPQTIFPSLCLGNKIVYATPDGVWVGENKKSGELLKNEIINDCKTRMPAEESLIVSELVRTEKNEGLIWEYLTDVEMGEIKSSRPPSGDKLGLSKTDFIGATYFLCDREDPRRRKVRVQARIPIIKKDIGFDYTVSPPIKTPEDFFVAMTSEAKESIRIVEGELNEITDSPFQVLALKDAAKKGVDIQIVVGPNIYIKQTDFSEIYKKPIELKDNLTLSFSRGGLATIGKETSSEETIKTDREKALIFSYVARMNEKPVIFSLAERACRNAMKEEGESYELLSLLAYNQYRNADFSGSIRTTEKARGAAIGTPYEAEACSNLGFIYPKIGRYEDAISVLEKGIKLNEEQTYIHNNLATVYHLLAASSGKPEHFNNADRYYRKELENTPDHPTAEKMLSQVNKLERLILT